MTGTSPRDRYGLAAFAIYLALATLFFGRGLVGHLSTRHIGKPIGDPALVAWFLRWMAHAVASRVNPLHTNLLWAPGTFNMTWTTWMPIVGLILTPITLTAGVVFSLNLSLLIALPLSAWGAFVLYRYVTGAWWPALAGGYLFGFSGYMLYRLWEGDPQLLLVFPVPLMLWIALRALDRRSTLRCCSISLTIMLVVEFLISLEVFATATLFAAIFFALAYALLDEAMRERLRRLLLPVIASYVAAVVIVLPYLYVFLSQAAPRAPMWQPFLYSADLVFFLLPSWAGELALLNIVSGIFGRMPDTVIYVGFCYLGPVMLAIIIAFAVKRWREPGARLLLWMMLILAVLACGPWLMIGGHRLMRLPGALLAQVPLLRNALPVWFTMYLMLAAGLVFSMWLASSGASPAIKCAVVLAAAVFAMPRLSAGFWDAAVDTPAFFLTGAYRDYLRPGEIVLPIPYGWTGNSLMWQAQSDMYFRMAGAWTGPPPAEFERWPAMVALFNGRYLPDPQLQVKAFLAAHQVSAVVVDASIKDSADARQRQEYQTILAALGPPPVEQGGVLIYRYTAAALASWRGIPPQTLERRVNLERFAALLDAVERYVQSGADLTRLDPAHLERTGLIRGDWLGGPNIRISDGLWTKSNPDGTIEVGTFGSRGALGALRAAYGGAALKVSATPVVMAENPGGAQELELMVMTFDRAGLVRAAQRSRASVAENAAPAAADDRQASSPAPNDTKRR